MVLNMSTDKSPSGTPTYIVTADPSCNEKARRMNQNKKLIIAAVSAVIVVSLIVATVLIGIHLVTKSLLDIVEFNSQFKTRDNQNANQTTTSDPNTNVVTYHVVKADQDAYIIDDFNRGIQTVRIQSPSGTTCYVTPLNQSDAMNPSMITGPDSKSRSGGGSSSQPFILSTTPVVDRSFMTPKAADLCSGVSVYWAYRACGGVIANDNNSTLTSGQRKKRSVNCGTYQGMQGYSDGCCTCYYACSVSGCTTYYYADGTCASTCTITYGSCCGYPRYVPQPYCSHWYYYKYC